MSTNALILLAAVAIFAALVVGVRKRQSKGEDIAIPPAPLPRNDLRLGYYLTLPGQADETADHVNLHWEAEHMGPAGMAQNMRTLQSPTVIELTGLLFERLSPTQLRVLPDDERWAKLTAFFDGLRAEGVLHFVHALAPFDEPNLYFKDAAETRRAIDITRRLQAAYPELTGAKLACIYMTDGRPYHCLQDFDLVGFDDYKAKSSIFKPGGEYDRFTAQLRPGQQTILVPGGAYDQDPTPFVNFANAHTEVWAIVPFMWADRPGDSGLIPGIRSRAVREAYVRAGKAIKGVD